MPPQAGHGTDRPRGRAPQDYAFVPGSPAGKLRPSEPNVELFKVAVQLSIERDLASLKLGSHQTF